MKFSELPHLIARALHSVPPEDDEFDLDYGCARVNLDAELPRAVHAGLLTVRDPAAKGPHTFPYGQALQDSLVKVSDLRAFLADRAMGVRVGKDLSPPSLNVLRHSTKTKRRDPLDVAIELAQKQCKDAKDTAEVWGQLQALALAESPPLLGVTPDGLKYIKHGDEAAHFTRDALDKRLHPEKRRKRPEPPPPAA